MWARRIGVPPLWPSRIKVVILCLVILTFVYSFFAYLHDANVNYLELSAPKESGITCGRVPEKCWNDASPLACGIKEYSWGFTSLPIDKVLTSACPVEYLLQSCSNVSHPLSSLHTDLAKLHTLNRYTNPFGGWAYLYFIMMACLGVSIMAHDLCLLVEDLRPRIHSLRVVQADMPFVWSMSCGIQFLWPMGRLQEKAKPLWLLLWLPWASGQALAVLVPVAGLSFILADLAFTEPDVPAKACWRIVVFMLQSKCFVVVLWRSQGAARIARVSGLAMIARVAGTDGTVEYSLTNGDPLNLSLDDVSSGQDIWRYLLDLSRVPLEDFTPAAAATEGNPWKDKTWKRKLGEMWERKKAAAKAAAEEAAKTGIKEEAADSWGWENSKTGWQAPSGKGGGYQKPCFSFRDRGECRNGDSCVFLHEAGGAGDASGKGGRSDSGPYAGRGGGGGQGQQVCRMFAQNGDCSFGERCRFAHEKKS
ncbi:unnamed protein product [Polarella glacialis]|uniref:C3H1-type domain-containing protein n=5 Tax=Polarella glacialis TaxID=89957 RepID=A0A813JQP0_POLGL|nr:unnamed protein product [Polarella glacialis]